MDYRSRGGNDPCVPLLICGRFYKISESVSDGDGRF
jgi:hypothetical protein